MAEFWRQNLVADRAVRGLPTRTTWRMRGLANINAVSLGRVSICIGTTYVVF